MMKKRKDTYSMAQERLRRAAALESEQLLREYQVDWRGLYENAVEVSRETFGENRVARGDQPGVLARIFGAFINPFSVVLLVLAIVSAVTDIVLAAPEDRSYATVMIILVMVLLSGLLRLVQETRSGNAAAKLSGMIHTTTSVRREGKVREIPVQEVVVGDLIELSAGDMIPADLRIIEAKDLFVSQSALTGESEPVEKVALPQEGEGALTELSNLAFMGSNVVSGSSRAMVVAVGSDTLFGSLAKDLEKPAEESAFEKGIRSVSWLLIRFMIVMAPLVFVINGLTDCDWMSALLFSISVAVGLTPEMLPMIVTTSLAKGALAMGRKKVIIKNLNAIQNLGAIDVFCTDKTGTLTQDKVVLEYHLTIDGKEDDRVLRHAFLNSYFQTGLKNLIDVAVIEKQNKLGSEALISEYTKVDEIPFDFERRRMSVVVQDRLGKTQMVTKGAVEEMLACCDFAECGGKVRLLSDAVRQLVLDKSRELNEKGMRVIAVAQKTNPSPTDSFSVQDEQHMVLIGFLALLDPPKASTESAVRALREHGVEVKILTGDNETVTCAIARQVGLDADRVLLGADMETMDDKALAEACEQTTIFAKLSPAQKARLVSLLKQSGHSVGYMGDGINDAAALKTADVGISVDTAVDVAKESASVVLLEKDLMVLEQGIMEGRKTYANMIKYIKMTASSNFGNIFSVLIASAFLPFLPMEAIHLILLNLIYDVACMGIAWDHVDEDYLTAPRRWDAGGISRFMLHVGPVSTLFDIATFLLLYFVICPMATGGQVYSQLTDPAARQLYMALFQSGWFIESMWSQSLVIHMLRTDKVAWVQSRASWQVTIPTLLGIGAVTLIPFTPLGAALSLAALPPVYFLWLLAIVVGYIVLTNLVKRQYVRRYHTWL